MLLWLIIKIYYYLFIKYDTHQLHKESNYNKKLSNFSFLKKFGMYDLSN